MGMSSYVMDCEDTFIDKANAVIGECDDINDLLQSLEEAGHMKLCVHMTDTQKLEFVDEIWNEYWSDYNA